MNQPVSIPSQTQQTVGNAHLVQGNGVSFPAVPVVQLGIGRNKRSNRYKAQKKAQGKFRVDPDLHSPPKATKTEKYYTEAPELTEMKAALAKRTRRFAIIHSQLDRVDQQYMDSELAEIRAAITQAEALTRQINVWEEQVHGTHKTARVTRRATVTIRPKHKLLVELKSKVITAVNKLLKIFPLNEGGFGAKARAHAMAGTAVAAAGGGDRTYFENIRLGGNALNRVATGKTDPREASGPTSVMNNSSLFHASRRKDILTTLEALLSPIQSSKKSFDNVPAGADRGDGQKSNMGNTNAAGYAHLANIDNWNRQRWEWLHLRGAGLGGKTDSTNLVAGVRDANTHMIPFESNIRALGKLVSESSFYKKLNVEWKASSPVDKHGIGQTHTYENIHIDWSLTRKDNRKSRVHGEAVFKPLQTNNNISKAEVEELENVLEQMRAFARNRER